MVPVNEVLDVVSSDEAHEHLCKCGTAFDCYFDTCGVDRVDGRLLGGTERCDDCARKHRNIRMTQMQTWPRCDGHTPSDAEDWAREFTANEVEAWLEVGVFTVGSACDLDTVGIEPRDVMREHVDGVTLGLAFARGELTIAQVQLLVLGEEIGT
jgi:hypothetical protein